MIQFIKDNFEFIQQEPGIEGAYKMAELAARTCYRSENYIKEGSAHKIVDDICIKNGHTSITEFATIYLKVNIWNVSVLKKYIMDRYSRVNVHNASAYITTTLRTIIQGDYDDPIDAIKNNFDRNWKEDLQYWCEPTEYHHKRYCYKFECDRVGSQSFERHRGIYGISYAQESTRYCNYNGKKFGGTIKISLPSKFYELIEDWSGFADIKTGKDYSYLQDCTLDVQLDFLYKNDKAWKVYVDGLNKDADDYISLINAGWKPEDARGTLPLDLDTTFMMCAYPEDWKMWLYRRTDSHAHPHVRRIAKEVENDMKKRGIV